MERRNKNRGFKQLRVWQDAVKLYVLVCKILNRFPFELKKSAANSIDAALSISRNIAEGYCRRSLSEYLGFLNYSRGSCGELHSDYESYRAARQITAEEYEQLDELHYKVENQLLKLIESLQRKQTQGVWEDTINQD
jgi:four helix bundle protein